jgi:predicted enzyme related to lactoylglutathione lyase
VSGLLARGPPEEALKRRLSVQNNPVVWFEIYVNDMARARKFYEKIFDIRLDKMDSPDPDIEMVAFPMAQNLPGAGGVLAKMKGFEAGGNGVIVYFTSEDCAIEAGRVEAAGGRVHFGKRAIGQHGFIALAFDTEGNMFGLHSRQ